MIQTAQNQGTATANAQLDVELRKVFKVFEGKTAVRGVDLNIHQGEFFSILGPSGCGKTTTLRMIAGFDLPSAGEVMIRGKSMTQTPPYRRPVNTVFQSYALFNHLNVSENIAFGLKIRKVGKAETQDKVREALHLVQMEEFANRYPYQLSGGQQQRVALARALVNRPAVLLLDEPLGALDLKLRKQMQMELSNLHEELGMTFIMVTHDQEEAMSMSDRIAVMNEGRIEQIGSPQSMYERPATEFVAKFLGDTNLFKGQVEAIDRDNLVINTNHGLKIVVGRDSETDDFHVGSHVVVSLRPEKVDLSLYAPDSSVNCFAGELANIMYLGTHINYIVKLESGDYLTVRQPNNGGTLPELHTPVYAFWNINNCLPLHES
jgi:spermidine/putrescine transport system ATP-binding protein